MIEVLRNHLVSRLGGDIEKLDEVLSVFTEIKTKRNELLLRQGDICRHVYFVARGCLQVFVYDRNMNETTRDIITENNWCSELISFGGIKPSAENIRCVDPCELLAIDRSAFQTTARNVPAFDKVYKQILEASYANSVYRINTFVSLSALERVQWLMEQRPLLMTRLSNKLIASYLGISQETLSRLKSRI